MLENSDEIDHLQVFLNTFQWDTLPETNIAI